VTTNVEARARSGDGARCAYCHDLLGAEPVSCPRCGTQLHQDCVVATKCPTYGCEHAFPVSVRQPAPGRAGRGVWFSAFVGVVLPVLAFTLNERGLARGIPVIPETRGGPDTWIRLAYAPEAQRSLYPLIAWAIAAYIARLRGRRAPWVRVGLWGGVLVSLLASILYARVIDAAFYGIVFFGVGLLGFTPYTTLLAYLRAAILYEGAPREESKEPPLRTTLRLLGFTSLWSLLAAGGTALAIERMNALFQALPEPVVRGERCYLATVAARGNARVTRATLVRFEDGRERPVSLQLRRFKAFELALLALAPRAHRALRAVYDRVGPGLAARVGPRGATVLHVIFVPAELACALVLRALFENPRALVDVTYPS
jgi:hypothetical protein